MKLTNEMKLLIAFCYTDANALRYEFVFDKPCNYFAIRFFMNEYSYLYVEFDKDISHVVHVREWECVKSHYHPSDRCTHLNKYMRRYRNPDKTCTLHVQDLIKILSKMPLPQGFTCDRTTYKPWRSVRRASGRY